MPLSFIEPQSPEYYVAVWKYTENEEIFLFLEEEIHELATIKLAKKQVEFVVARILCKVLCDTLGMKYEGLGKEITGKPFLHGYNDQISISHCLPYVGVVLHKHLAVGIDIEREQEKLYRIAPRVFSRQEMLFCGDDLAKITTVWCCKEVLYKIYAQGGNTFQTDFLIEPFESHQNTLEASICLPDFQKKYHISTRTLDGQYKLCFGTEPLLSTA